MYYILLYGLFYFIFILYHIILHDIIDIILYCIILCHIIFYDMILYYITFNRRLFRLSAGLLHDWANIGVRTQDSAGCIALLRVVQNLQRHGKKSSFNSFHFFLFIFPCWKTHRFPPFSMVFHRGSVSGVVLSGPHDDLRSESYSSCSWRGDLLVSRYAT